MADDNKFIFTHELIEKYIENPPAFNKAGIYQINCNNAPLYFGISTECLLTRIGKHIEALQSQTHPNLYIQTNFNLYPAFYFKIIEIHNTVEIAALREAEKFYIYSHRDNHLLANIQHNHANSKIQQLRKIYSMLHPKS